MIVTCPSCETRFSVPEAAIGPRGRVLRCSRCGHKWHQDPPADDFPLETPLPEEPEPVFAPIPEPEEPVREVEVIPEPAAVEPVEKEEPAEPAPEPAPSDETTKTETVEDPFANIAELMMKSAPEPIPELFSSSPSPETAPRRGKIGFSLLLTLVVLAIVAGALYLFQDAIVQRLPMAGGVYDTLGLRNKVVGKGLVFRDIDSERIMRNNVETLVVRGVIANTTGDSIDLPAIKLALYGNEKSLQEKIVRPPQAALGAKSSIGFRMTLDRPNAEASRFEVTFSPLTSEPAVPPEDPPATPPEPEGGNGEPPPPPAGK